MRKMATAVFLVFFAGSASAAEKPKPGPGADAPKAERHYRFARIELATASYQESFKALFDDKPTFDRLENKLRSKSIAYTLSAECRTAMDFPELVRARLEGFKPGDNLFDRGEEMTVIWKIMGIYRTAADCMDALGRLSTLPEPRV